MNKCYRLGKEFAKEHTDKELINYLQNNDLCNTWNKGKDFTESDYIKLCDMVGSQVEQENKHYSKGERKYYFYWGMDGK